MALRFLVVEGNARDAREQHAHTFGMTPSQSYAAVVESLARDAVCDIAFPADEGANLPDPAGLESYDGVFLTGSALHAYHGQPEVTRQIELARAVFRSRTPLFGSCWGLQMGALAAGGDVGPNPVGREVGFARRLTRTDNGASHPLLAGRPAAWDAPAIHLDLVTALPGDITLLAGNAMTPVQAAEIRFDGGVMWGVQYHPEFSLDELAAIIGRRAGMLIGEGFFRDEADHGDFVADLKALHAEPGRRDIAWRFGLDEQVIDEALRLTEIRNFIDAKVRPYRSERGRA
ncbi:type 1 glutamine amidotransferase [Alsobacter sp. SYSU M60028]|uniref:Type 1 glutamine amidotransferase n=1 Tax=Alsobacter ponti TaxID=2962936 RepID=A0ABT1LGE5_9HYPH|nr:type 1 glutamine amidotransferase [Alsobacter ponti]MCP8940183.1 type 1 glutamine amidotransferase [Alsobacter ponti]